VLVETPAGKSIEQLSFRNSPFCHPAGELDLPNSASPHRLHIEFAASVGSRAASISFEQSDQEQENHRPDDCHDLRQAEGTSVQPSFTESGIRDKNDEGWAPQAHLRDRRTSGFPLPELGSVPASGTRDLVVRFDSKANGTGTLRQFVSKATRPKLPGGLLLSPGSSLRGFVQGNG
jgi:hypothetical protein